MTYSLAAQNTFPVTGNVGIGTSTPIRPLTVNGEMSMIPYGPPNNTAFFNVSDNTGNNGGNYSLDLRGLDSNGSAGVHLAQFNVFANTTSFRGTITIGNPMQDGAGTPENGILFLDTLQGDGFTVWAHAAIYTSGRPGYNGDLAFATDDDNLPNINPTEKMRILAEGNVGIGTPSPAAKLEVNGNVRLTSGSGSSMTYADGTVQSTAWNGTTLGGDYAESIDVLGDRAAYAPGDVIVIDPASPGRFAKSGKAYSKLIAGVYSTKPGLVGRRVTFERLDKAAEVPMAMVGIVPTKVSTENGAIEPGDLLVSSSKPGYAMKGTDPIRLTGAILGKALAPLSSGDGVIEVMISIQ